MKLINIEFQNFGNYGSVDLDLSKYTEPTSIIGEIDNDPRRSNGAGKSVLIDGVLYALYGTGRVNSESELIKLGKKDMFVKLKFEMSGQVVVIKRSRTEKSGRLKLEIDGNDVSEGIVETQKKIVQLMNCDSELFLATSYFAQGKSDTFISATGGKKREYTEMIFDLLIWGKRAEYCKVKAKEFEQEIVQIESKNEHIKSEMEKIDIEKLKSRKVVVECDLDISEKSEKEVDIFIPQFERDIEIVKEYDFLKRQFDESEPKRKSIEADILKNKSDLVVHEKLLSDIFIAKEKAVKELPDITGIKSERDKALEELGVARSDKSRASAPIDLGEKCSTCGQEIPVSYRNNLEVNRMSLIKKADEFITAIQDKIKSFVSAIEAWDVKRLEITKFDSRMAEGNMMIKNEKKVVESLGKDLEYLVKQQSEFRKMINPEKNLDELVLTLSQKKEIKEKMSGEIRILSSEISDINVKIDFYDQNNEVYADNKKKLIEKRAEMDDMRLLMNAFGKNGIPAKLTERYLSEIESVANTILGRVNSSMQIKIESSKKLKTGKTKEEINIIISTSDGDRPYSTFSGGEKMMINFSVRMAISEILSHRNNNKIGCVFLDEVFGALDESNTAEMVSVINELKTKFNQIFIITHKGVADIFPQSIVVSKNQEGSFVKK